MGYLQVELPAPRLGLGNDIPSVPTHTLTRSDSVHDGLAGLPSGFPSSVCHPFAWAGADFAEERSFVYILSSIEKIELRRAKDEFKAQELDGNLVNRDNFPLPTLGPKLQVLGDDIHNGKGFHVIRGLDPNDYSVEDLAIIQLGVQAHIADQCGRQDHRGNMLVHIIADNSSEIKLGHHRHSTSAISFHNEEAGDVISWLTRSTSKTGGRCILAPVYTIYNILAVHRPDVIRTLTKSDWPVALPRFQCRPLLFYHESRLMMNFGRTPLLGSATHPRPEHLPRLNDRQREALDLVEAIAQAVQVEIKTHSGDMHFINNFTILHRREGFVDGASPDEKRHLVRMRLRSSSKGWSIPESLHQEWADAFAEDGPKTWHLEPMPGDAFPLRKYTN
ncbi:putative taurine catabolism dioxygenase [Rosellinia necatrix]|uniref:Putative taurine catabolism dioxygenase n=1 Tax=Rosellinia necatrix TaxID=77044 RepID=A0A1W2TD98_ROSNE|nr:putative taurine catabolism dioxygenase [Rosellinia necatrix]